ncbi:MAG: TonB-dependent receptor [Herminiimonas sp.]|nr:TonB-dependent receptor [Herminiimonas sp.]
MSNFLAHTPRARASARAPVLLSLVCCALSAAFPLHAWSQTVSETALAPIVVTAARVAQPQTDALPFTTVISAEDIRRSQAVDLPALLRREAGIQFTQNGGLGQASGLFVRGAETRQTLVLIDGVPLTKQDATGTVSIEHLMLDQIDRIEIVRGNVSSIYGSSAIGGVIQIFTRRGAGPARVTAEAEAGSRGTTRVAAGLIGNVGGAGASEAFHYALNASNFRTNGFSSLNPGQVPAANPDRDGYRNSSVSGSLSRDFGSEHEVGLNFSATRGRFDFDSSFGAPTDVQTGRTDVSAFSLFSQNRLTQRWSSRVTLAESRDRNANHYDTAFGITDDRYRSRTRSLQWTNEIALTEGWSATAGAERQWQRLDTDDGFGDLLGVARNANSAFAGVQGKVGVQQFQFNVRHDRIDRLESATTGYLGYGLLLSDAWKLLASAATGFAAPPLGYLYSPGFGNPDLKPERSRSFELGAQYQRQGTLMRAGVFDTRTRQQLQYDPVANTFANIARAKNRGLEVSASTTVAETAVRASLTLQDPRDESTGARLRRRAQTLASLGADRAFGAWQVGGDIGFTGARPDGGAQLPAYALVNLTTRYRLTKSVELYGRIENAFDRDYQTATGYNQPPRGVFAGVRWQP